MALESEQFTYKGRFDKRADLFSLSTTEMGREVRVVNSSGIAYPLSVAFDYKP